MSGRTRFSVVAATILAAAALAHGLAQPATSITLEIGAGPHQGSYETTSRDVTCSYGYAGEGLWGNQYSIDASTPETFSSLQLIVDARAAQEGTSEFLTTVSFGPLFTPQSTSYTINTRSDEEGSGFLTLDDRGGSATVHLEGVSGDGVPVSATIECHQVVRAGPSIGEMEQEEAEAAPGPLSLAVGGEEFDFAPTMDEASCAEGLAEEYDFQYTFYPLEGDGRISSFEVYLYDSRRPSEAGFYLSVYGEAYELSMDTSPEMGEGSGTASIRREGSRRVVTVSATSAEGVPLEASLECSVE